MNHMIIFQASDVMSKSADIAQKDPHGFIITAVSILVVFSSLIILYFAYKFIGIVVNKTCSRSSRKSSSIDEETATAISMALEQHLAANVHDKESYIITIKRK